jgi:hypothetical protein
VRVLARDLQDVLAAVNPLCRGTHAHGHGHGHRTHTQRPAYPGCR